MIARTISMMRMLEDAEAAAFWFLLYFALESMPMRAEPSLPALLSTAPPIISYRSRRIARFVRPEMPDQMASPMVMTMPPNMLRWAMSKMSVLIQLELARRWKWLVAP